MPPSFFFFYFAATKCLSQSRRNSILQAPVKRFISFISHSLSASKTGSDSC